MPSKGKYQINILKLISKAKTPNSLPSKTPYPTRKPRHVIIQIQPNHLIKLFADIFLINRFDTLCFI